MLLQPRLNLKVSQRQVLTPGLVQMVGLLALNKLELREMINNEMIENPVLEEVEEFAPTLDEIDGREADRDRSVEQVAAEGEKAEKVDPFDEIDFGSYFQDYLDPGFRTASNFEESDKPSFEHFLSQPGTLSDHLTWQLGSLTLEPPVRLAAELVIGNLNENGYLTVSDEELVEALLEMRAPARPEPIPFERGTKGRPGRLQAEPCRAEAECLPDMASDRAAAHAPVHSSAIAEKQPDHEEREAFRRAVLHARALVTHMDPVGVGARDLRECLLIQIAAHREEAILQLRRRLATSRRAADVAELEERGETGTGNLREAAAPMRPGQAWAAAVPTGHERARVIAFDAPGRTANEQRRDVFDIAAHIVGQCLALLQKKDMRELTRSCARPGEEVQAAVEYIRTLDPRPGQRYNQSETRLIEPDVAFVKRDGEYLVVMNEEDMPTLRLSHAYRRMLRQKQTEKEVKEYVKERYKSAIQLLRNIEQRKNTIARTCEVIVRRQADFLERGEQALRPMMIKEVAEEIGVHPSTVSRAVANKYVHTTQGVYELRFFFSEGVNGPEGGDLPLVLLKRKVKKLIEEEDSRKPLTDDQLAAELQRQGIQVTRRTVAKYREDLQIPSTHQRRVR